MTQRNHDKPARILDNDKKEIIVKTCAEAFFNDPLVSYFFQDENKRAQKLNKFFSFVYKWVLKKGEIYAYPENEPQGVCLLLPSDKYHQSILQMLFNGALRLMFSLNRDELKRSNEVNEQMLKLHKKLCPFPHQYLQVLAVKPESQGKGVGGTLLKFISEQADKNNTPVYLETLIESNSKIYEKFGFNILETEAILNTPLTIYTMLREPDKKKNM